jgi:hypothetical protein
MNKFINDPNSLGSLLGCAFWLVVLSGAMALLFTGIVGIFR